MPCICLQEKPHGIYPGNGFILHLKLYLVVKRLAQALGLSVEEVRQFVQYGGFHLHPTHGKGPWYRALTKTCKRTRMKTAVAIA